MRFSVFFKSTIRQPLRTLFLLFLTGVISFLFITRAAEYILIHQETSRISRYYRSIGTLDSISTEPDLEAASDYLEQNSYINLTVRTRICSGVMDSIYNADTDGIFSSVIENHTDDVFFYGTLSNIDQGASLTEFDFIVNDVVTGLPERIAEKGRIRIYSDNKNIDPLNMPDIGGRYLVHAVYDSQGRDFISKVNIINPSTKEKETIKTKIMLRYELKPLMNDTMFLPAKENLDLTQPQYESLQRDITFASDNQHSIKIIATPDMSAMPLMQEVSKTFYLKDGRWLNAEDNHNENRVCVIHSGLAQTRRLNIGDSISIKLRNIKNSYGYLVYDNIKDSNNSAELSETFKIVGIYDALPDSGYDVGTFYFNEAYIPSSVYPDDFVTKFYGEGMVSGFELTSPVYEDEFILETQDTLAGFGYRIIMIENGFEEFNAVSESMCLTSLYNLLIFSAALLMALFLITFIYFRFRRRDIAISRALGMPVSRCVCKSVVPLMMAALIAVPAGGIPAWKYAEQNAAELLKSLESFGNIETAVLPVKWLYLLCLAIFVLLDIIAVIFAANISGKRVLNLLQGGSDERAHIKNTAVTQSVQVSESVPKISISKTGPVVNKIIDDGKNPGLSQIFRFVWRYISRSHVKTVLSILLAAVFMVGLSIIYSSILNGQSRLNELYRTVKVDAEIVKKQSGMIIRGEGFIYDDTVQAILDLGFTDDYYLEGANISKGITNLNNGNGAPEVQLRSFSEISKFFDDRGENRITYFENWNETLFDWKVPEGVKDITMLDGAVPAIIPKEIYDGCSMEPGDEIIVTKHNGRANIMVFAAGVHDYSENEGILMPMDAMKLFSSDNFAYCKAKFNIDPSRNYEIADFRSALENIVSTPGAGIVSMSAVLWDQELNQAIKPLEQNISFMQILYPVVVGLSMLISAGTALLFTIMSSKEAAIMRVLGTSKTRSRSIICLQVLFTNAAGLVMGILVSWILISFNVKVSVGLILSQTIICATLYFTSAALGALISSAGVTKRNPLELLQVKE